METSPYSIDLYQSRLTARETHWVSVCFCRCFSNLLTGFVCLLFFKIKSLYISLAVLEFTL